MPQDFSGQNLRGRSFKGQNLEGANFSGADIRSADFTGATLTGANFSHATAGLQKRWATFLVGVSWLLSGVSGFFSAFTGALIAYIFDSSSLENQVGGWIALIVVIVVFILIFRQGLNSAIAFAIAVAIAVAIAFAIVGAFAIAIAGAGVLLSAYMAWRAMKGDKKYAIIQNIAVDFAASSGTSFRNTNLTDANFTAATLKSTDFRKAILTRACFNKTKKLDRVRPGTTYLQKTQVVSVLVTGQGQDLNFDREDLRGVNFQGSNLVDASFIGADLSKANLKDADFSRAKLVQAQLDGTNFTGATLTGAYIQDWGITSDTKFDGVRCEYVYMRLPTKENPDPLRKPDNNKEVFADGEFRDFIQPIFDTLDLYHNQGVDPRAIAISFKQLAENHPEADLRIVGMEVRGEDKFLLRAKTAIAADKSQLSSEYFTTYNEIKGLPEREIKLLLAEKDSRIRSLETMVVTALERPSFYSNVEQVGTMTNNPGGFSIGGSVSGDINNVQGDNNQQRVSNKTSNFDLKGAQFAGGLVNADTVNADQIGGDITNYGQQQQQKEAQTETNNSAVKTILILVSNPKNTSPLRLDEEVREIDAGLQRAKKRELFDLRQRWAVRVQEVYQALLDFKPQIIHFSGHGAGEHGLVLEDDAGNLKLVNTEALAQLF
ncbi:MAG: pentapeptide repeat-containing protein, partial [Nostoc sp.]